MEALFDFLTNGFDMIDEMVGADNRLFEISTTLAIFGSGLAPQFDDGAQLEAMFRTTICWSGYP